MIVAVYVVDGKYAVVSGLEASDSEYVMTKVVVSPAQKSIPSITANGKRLTVELRDTMLPNTTYTIDFSDRHYILDLNVFVEVYGYFVGFNTLRAYCRIALHVVGRFYVVVTSGGPAHRCACRRKDKTFLSIGNQIHNKFI